MFFLVAAFFVMILGVGAPSQAQVPAPPAQPDILKAMMALCDPSGAVSPADDAIQDCYVQQLRALMEAQGATIGMIRLYQLAGASPRFANICHVISHHLADAMYSRVNNIAEAMALCQEGCSYACQHTVLAAYLRELPKGTLPDIERLCPTTADHAEGLLGHRHCVHGAGHGFEYYFQDVPQALSACQRFPVPMDRSFCTKGVFMEHPIQIMRTQAPRSDPVHYLDLCATVALHLRGECYFYFIPLISWASGGASQPMFSACDSIPSANRGACYKGIGRALGAQYLDREDALMGVCRSGPAEYATHCHIGFAAIFASFLGVDRGFGFCAKLPEEERAACAKQVGVVVQLQWAGEDRVSAECEKAGAPGYVRACLDALLDDGEPSSFAP